MTGERVIGIDRCQAEAVMRMLGVKPRRQAKMLARLLIMESAALPILNAG